MEEYITYWGLEKHPFLMAPDSRMMYVAGQYYECLERLKFAVSTNKGGVLLVSEDAGLGKTTLLMKLLDDLRDTYGESFRSAVVDHPTMSPAQIVAHITASVTGCQPQPDKLLNLTALKEHLVGIHRKGGKCVIVVDEGQLLCTMEEVLQELRILINLTYENQYLHTFILSGQRALWGAIKGMSEFWQRLPVRYYLVPLELEDTKGLVSHRLAKAGVPQDREIFTDDALQIIHRYSRGSPRSIVALCDLSLLVGFTNRTNRVTFKEVSKAMNAMSGRGESLPYVGREGREEKEVPRRAREGKPEAERPAPQRQRGPDAPAGADAPARSKRERKFSLGVGRVRGIRLGPISTGILLAAVLLAGAAGYYKAISSLFGGGAPGKGTAEVIGRTEVSPGKAPLKGGGISASGPSTGAAAKQEKPPEREAIVIAGRANVREQPNLSSGVVNLVEKGTRLVVEGEDRDAEGSTWYRISRYGGSGGWISEKVVILPKPPGAEPVPASR